MPLFAQHSVFTILQLREVWRKLFILGAKTARTNLSDSYQYCHFKLWSSVFVVSVCVWIFGKEVFKAAFCFQFNLRVWQMGAVCYVGQLWESENLDKSKKSQQKALILVAAYVTPLNLQQSSKTIKTAKDRALESKHNELWCGSAFLMKWGGKKHQKNNCTHFNSAQYRYTGILQKKYYARFRDKNAVDKKKKNNQKCTIPTFFFYNLLFFIFIFALVEKFFYVKGSQVAFPKFKLSASLSSWWWEAVETWFCC